VGILAQRLIRTLCPNCKEQYPASDLDMAFLKRQYGEKHFDELELGDEVLLSRGKGCEECSDTGYRGRTGVHELLSMTPDLRGLIYKESSVNEMKEQAVLDGMRNLTQDAVLKVLKGDTDISQVQLLSGHD
jgi:type II secretory ATPase GspE/PulE/Tfp pilus assembly ATPase PilB-like protein